MNSQTATQQLVQQYAQIADSPEQAEAIDEHVRAVLDFVLSEVDLDDLTTRECLQLCALLAPAHSRKLRAASGRPAPVIPLLSAVREPAAEGLVGGGAAASAD